MTNLTEDLKQKLRAGWVRRCEITDALGIPKGVRQIVEAFAGAEGLVPERMFSGEKFRSQYHVRPPRDGEEIGKLVVIEPD